MEYSEFKSRVAIVTGGSSGMGRAVCLSLAKCGAKVYNLDISDPEEDFQDIIESIKVDTSKLESLEQVVEYIVKKEGKIDHLFACAGIFVFGNVEEVSLEDFERCINVNFKGMFFTLRVVLPVMKKNKYGSVVLMGSDQCFIGKGGCSVYGATKGAIGQLTKGTAVDYAEHGIRVNCVCPGSVETKMFNVARDEVQKKYGGTEDDVTKDFVAPQLFKRLGKPSEVSNVVLFLLSDKASFVTGSLYRVDGGIVTQ